LRIKSFAGVGAVAALLGAGALCSAAAAATPAPPAAPAPRIFVSPSGEPFRLGPAVPDPLKAWFDQADANHDGVIDRAEFRADALRFFKKLDENGDGVIDGFETADYEAKVVPEFGEIAEGRFPGQFGPARGDGEKGGERDHDHGRGGGRSQGGGGLFGSAKPAAPRQGARLAQLIDEPEPVTGADYALDGNITLAEWMKATDQRFEILDAAHTGRLTLDELRARLNPPKPAKR
jgi:hypothetical protein